MCAHDICIMCTLKANIQASSEVRVEVRSLQAAQHVHDAHQAQPDGSSSTLYALGHTYSCFEPCLQTGRCFRVGETSMDNLELAIASTKMSLGPWLLAHTQLRYLGKLLLL